MKMNTVDCLSSATGWGADPIFTYIHCRISTLTAKNIHLTVEGYVDANPKRHTDLAVVWLVIRIGYCWREQLYIYN